MAVKELPYAFAKTFGVFLSDDGSGRRVLWVRRGSKVDSVAEARRAVGLDVPLELVDGERFDQALTKAYSESGGTSASIVDDAGAQIDLDQLINELPPIEDLLDRQDDAPVIRLINALLSEAVRESASDIHIEAEEDRTVVRLRRDGELHEVLSPHRALHAAMASRIKILAQLDIAEKRLPQDGRFGIRLAGRQVDIRVSTVPTSHGERVVMRLLDKDPKRLALVHLGLAADTLADVTRALKAPHGIVLVTGPTGSGKTTTLYSALLSINARERNIMTVEDPVEYDLPGIGQVQINSRIDMSFARALRAILRQDPDVVMIGEIRDLETAQIAIQASLTGHLVLATIHTNDSVSAVTRLMDMGVEPFLLASSLTGVLAQRLVRRLCAVCRQPDPMGMEREIEPQPTSPTSWRPVGCPECRHTGYQGRIGVFEWLEVDDDLKRLIHERVSEQSIR
ncbi:MAG: type II secretion system protein GspE, partial [Methylococcus sp.]